MLRDRARELAVQEPPREWIAADGGSRDVPAARAGASRRAARAGTGRVAAPPRDAERLERAHARRRDSGGWRKGQGRSLVRRRRLAVLAAMGLVDFAAISLYQLGVIRHLPDPPGRLFDSDAVNASRKAFATGIPGGTLGALLHASELVLLAASGTRETGRSPILDLLLGGAVVAGAGAAAHYLYDMAANEKRACVYCLVAAATAFAMIPLATPEVRSGIRALRARP
jgi:uncharacterized membrane protein